MIARQEYKLGDLIAIALQPINSRLRVHRLKRQLAQSVLDIALAEKNIENERGVISERQKQQVTIQAELRDYGVL
ncbi:hypothetical protein ACFQUU_08570 [Herbaspirillum sp. GCM10030257]|uniref:hypothetical protein n=1 Tax=Herbaspirillum sp. GCM10030257 TaxID=3273393 RepID=UPI003605C508